MTILVGFAMYTAFQDSVSPNHNKQALQAGQYLRKNAMYFRDTRLQPPLCFMYFFVGGYGESGGGPAVLAVDCERFAQFSGLLIDIATPPTPE